MLDEITKMGELVRALPTEKLDHINIGLLAAKALDFESDDKFQRYASSLHALWSFLFPLPTTMPTTKQQTAYDFYKDHIDKKDIPGHLRGIDFNEPVNISPLSNKIVAQWKGSSATISQGDYYGELHKTADCLGIYNKQEDYLGQVYPRKEYLFYLSAQVDVLQSTARSVLDTWSIKGKRYKTAGGCTQYFNKNDKQHFQKIFSTFVKNVP